MNKEELLPILNEVFVETFENDRLVINENTVAADIDEWDSLNHIQLVVAIEKRLKVKFKAEEIRDWKKVGDVCDSILQRLSPPS